MAYPIEPDQSTLLKFCWLVNKQRNAELAHIRAQWQVSYYKKIKAKLNSNKPVGIWNSLELNKKLEEVRLLALKQQKHLLDIRRNLRRQLAIYSKKLKARLIFAGGKIDGILISIDKNKWRTIEVKQISEMSDQYEAEKALNQALTK